MCCKISWKVWVVILSIISILLLLLVVKLIYDKATRDNLKAQALDYVNTAEASLQLEFDRINRENWNLIQNSTLDEAQKQRSRLDRDRSEESYEVMLQSLKAKLSALPWKSFNSSVLSRKLRVTHQFPVYLLSKHKTKNLRDMRSSIRHIQTEVIGKFENITQHFATFDHQLPKNVHYCTKKIMNRQNWAELHALVGNQVKPLYPAFVKLMNEEAILNKFPQASAYWLTSTYEEDISKVLTDAWEQLKPFYHEFHAYLRGELQFLFEAEKLPDNGAIPSQYLENVYSNPENIECSVVAEATRPYPGKPFLNITEELLDRRYSPVSMAKFADDFLSSMGLPTVSPSFWLESFFIKPKHFQSFDCTPKLFSLQGSTDFRLSLCGAANEVTLKTVNRFLIQAALKPLAKRQSFLFRQPVTPAINKAAEEALLMATSNSLYLRRMGLLSEYSEDLPARLNELYHEAFQLFPTLTRALAFNQWFLEVYTERVKIPSSNCHWWKIKSSFDGTRPPGSRKSTDFDVAAYPDLMSTPSNSIETFFTSVLKFQIFETLCLLASGQQSSQSVTDLGACDLSSNSAVGELLSKMLSAGSSKSWRDLLRLIGIKDGLNVTSMLNYFQPLHTYFQEVNRRRERTIGWNLNVNDYCK